MLAPNPPAPMNRSNVCVVADCASSAALAEAVASYQADAALVDWELPGLRIRDLPPACQIIAMSGRA